MMTPDEFADAVGTPLEKWAHQCHAASLALVRTRLFGGAQVARGACHGVGGQHSWVVLGDPYEPGVTILDPTFWSYSGEAPYVREATTGKDDGYTPHGSGSIYQYGKPSSHGGDTWTLGGGLSRHAQEWLDMIGPLDRAGWMELAHAPVGGWPAREILGAMAQDVRLGALIPIDVLGNLGLNPQGLYV